MSAPPEIETTHGRNPPPEPDAASKFKRILEVLKVPFTTGRPVTARLPNGIDRHYLAQFFVEPNIILEVDPKFYEKRDGEAVERDQALERAGYRVLRYSDIQVDLAHHLISELAKLSKLE